MRKLTQHQGVGETEKTIPSHNQFRLTIALIGILALAVPKAFAHTCPDGAVSTGVGLVLTAFRTNTATGTLQPLGPAGIGTCEQIFLQASLSYVPVDSQGNIVAAFSDGNVRITTSISPNPSYNVDVTPIGGVPQIGPIPSTCTPPSVDDSLGTQIAPYTVNQADIVNGFITFFAIYQNGTAHIGGDLAGVESATTAIQVRVTPGPTCTIAPPTATICEGASATFTGTATGSGPFTYAWRKGCPGAGAVLSTAATLTINNAQLSDASCYELSVTDSFGCISTCQATLAVTPNPTCTITGDSPVCPGSTHTYSSAVLPAGGTVTHSWTISGNGTINGAANGPTVSVTAGASGSFTLTDNVTRDGCPGVCTLTVPIAPPPTCTITGDTPVCPSSTHTYSSAVQPAGGTVTHSWTISGNGTINGAANGPTVSVTAGASGSFTLTDNITRDGCPGQCTLTVPVVPCAPEIEVVKEIACVLPGDTCGPFAKVATGIRDSDCPAFCYRVTVRNVSPDVPIVSLTVTDPVLGGDISSLFGPLPLAPGDSRTAIIKPIVHCVDTPDTVRVEGRSADNGAGAGVDTDEDSAEARVLNINIECTLSLSATNDADGNPNDAHVLLPNSGSVQLTLTLRNTGTSTLRVVAIDGLPALVDCVTGVAVTPTLPATLGPGQSTVFTACTAVSCPAGAQYNLTVHAEADDQNGMLCVHDRNGNRIGDETTCPAVVECEVGAGCTPGFWKNCTIHWNPTPYTTDQQVQSVFTLGGCCTDLGTSTLRQALDFGGGGGVCGAARNLLRAAVAALLNASSPEVNYPLTEAEVIASVNAALATCSRATINELAGELDRANNLGCNDESGNELPCKQLTTP